MPAIDTISSAQQSTSAPRKAGAITPHDTNELTAVTRGIWVGVTGHVAVILADDTSAVTFTNVPVGFFPVQAKTVLSTGTTATGLIAVYGG
jgi:hypothetical protein